MISLPSGTVVSERHLQAALRSYSPAVSTPRCLTVMGMRIAVPHKHRPGFLNTGHGDKRTMIVSVSLIDFR